MRFSLPRPPCKELAGTLLAVFILSQLLHVEKYFEHAKTSQKYSDILTLLETNFWKRLAPKIVARPAQRKPEDLSDWKNWDVIVQPFVSGGMFHVETPGCRIPRTNILPPKFSMWKKRFHGCAKTTVVTDLDDNSEAVKLKPKFQTGKGCTVTEIKRSCSAKGCSDNRYSLSDPVALQNQLEVKDKEVFYARCGRDLTFHAHFPTMPAVKAKIEYWNEQRNNTPISVLFMGFDTVSRSHFHRSLRNSFTRMRKLGFIDFRGYHSIVPYTLENLLSFLFGMTKEQLRKTCAPNWSTSFDNCSHIWNTYNHHNFVTMYAEDGSGSFNWGGQAGFRRPPTDYYPHRLFLAKEGSIVNRVSNGSRAKCITNKDDHSYLLEYTRRFVAKFKSTPFFSFTWFANPFHDYTYALYGFDDEFATLFQWLESQEELLKRTIIILVSDHGDRSSHFVRETYEGFLERSLPGLFIRLPEVLQEMHAGLRLKETLQANARKLTTGFDIFQTLHHLLVLAGIGSEVSSFEPAQKDRSSLFIPIREDRTCADVNVRDGICVCNASADAPSVTNPILRMKLYNFAIAQLNARIRKSEYSNNCYRFSQPLLPLSTATVLASSSGGGSSTILLRFWVKPKAVFEATISISAVVGSKVARMETVADFRRVDRYGSQSSCVHFDTDEDKKMKEICVCKKKSKAKSGHKMSGMRRKSKSRE